MYSRPHAGDETSGWKNQAAKGPDEFPDCISNISVSCTGSAKRIKGVEGGRTRKLITVL